MRRILPIILCALTLSACVSRPNFPGERFVDRTFSSKEQLEDAIIEQCTLPAVKSFCTEWRKIKPTREFSQPLITWLESNRRGEFTVANTYQVNWVAIVVGERVKACQIHVTRGKDRWLLRYEMAPDLPWEPWKIRQLIGNAEKQNSIP